MARAKNHGLLIAGGGAAASLAALAMARLRPEAPLLLVGEEARFGGGRTLLLFDEALGEEERALAEPLIAASWDGCYVAMPGRSRKLKLRCHAIAPERIDGAVRAALRPDQLRSEARIVAARDASLLLHGGETLAGEGALDARAWVHQTTLELGWRHGFARRLRFASPHRVDLPVLLDTTLAGREGCTFFTCLPLDETLLRIEHVRYGSAPDPHPTEGAEAIAAYVAARGWRGGVVEGEESGADPVALGGDFAGFWRIGGARVAKLGARGGFFDPLTGSPLPDALHTALALARHRDLGGEALHDLFEAQAAASWKRREFQRGFARQVLRGGRCTAIEALYSSDAALLERFLGERLGLFDKRRLAAAAGA